MITAKANIPKGWADNDALILPRNKKLMEWPMPQPGQKWMPINLKIQNE
jgi:hypothetical protein